MQAVWRYALLGMMCHSVCFYANGLNAATLESLVMPGPVITAHSDVEEQCGACHSPFSQAQQNQLCLECHEEVATDLQKRLGFHGIHPEPAETECRSCHVEHQGRDADIVGLVPEGFDHDNTNFPLSGAHASQPCASCHTQAGEYRGTNQTCVGCHESDERHDDKHKGNLGDQCGDCHATTRWSLTTFDHTQVTKFALRGAHADVSCTSCHTDEIYENTASSCAGCHALDDVHAGERGDQCQSCHTSSSWEDSSFDHRREAGFGLRGQHAEIICSACHLSNMALTNPPTDCAGCHSADDIHGGQRGIACADCHSTSRWQTEFDHQAASSFALRGAHSKVACDQCHHGNLQDPLATECEDCHQSADPHQGALVSCATCHNETSWTEQVRFDHEFTDFPLLGMHALATCDQCHLSAAFRDVDRACAECHADKDKHSSSLGTDCGHCHNPSGWALWQFDHMGQTEFALNGAHQDLVCSACHSTSAENPLAIASNCVGCHSSDDAHQGQFGSACERCHTTKSFTGARFD
jgi:hypothetical protein